MISNENKRILLDGSKVPELKNSVKLTIDSKCPKKWAFFDMETGDIWVNSVDSGNNGFYGDKPFWKQAGFKEQKIIYCFLNKKFKIYNW